MIKRTLYFGNPSYLSLTNAQLVLRLPEIEKNDTVPEHFKKEASASIPIEDIGIIILDHKQITITGVPTFDRTKKLRHISPINLNFNHEKTGKEVLQQRV